MYLLQKVNLDSSVDIVITKELWFNFTHVEERLIIDLFWVLPSLLHNGYKGIKRPGREANHSLPSSVEIKNG
jgi:hypothetical protein